MHRPADEVQEAHYGVARERHIRRRPTKSKAEGVVGWNIPIVKSPRLSELKRASRWLRAQYQKRADEAAQGKDRVIERIRKSKVRKRTL